jgi:hypothetical protein
MCTVFIVHIGIFRFIIESTQNISNALAVNEVDKNYLIFTLIICFLDNLLKEVNTKQK